MTIPDRPHVAIVTSGTRGDVQPALALGKGLKAAGYPVTLIAGSNFAAWIKSHEMDFADIGLDVDQVMATEEARAWKNSNQLTEIYHMKKLFDKLTDRMAASLTRLLPNYDVIITGGTTFPVAAAVAQAKEIPLFHLLKQPMYPTKSGPAYAMPIRPQADSWLNSLTHPLLLRGFWYAQAGSGMRAANKRLGAPGATYSDFAQAYLNTPTFMAVSPPVLPPPSDYPSYVHVTGFLFLDQGADWTPPSDLLDFLDAGEEPVYIGFGSMTGHTAKDTLALLVEALDGRRGIIDGGWSDSDTVPDSVYLLDGAPHDWLLPRMRALVHHGGSGTTAAGLRAGAPTLVIPHFFDQFYFGRRVRELGAGPEPIPRRELSAAALKNGLDTLLTDDSLYGRAKAVSQRIREENGVRNIVTLLDKYLRVHSKTATTGSQTKRYKKERQHDNSEPAPHRHRDRRHPG